MTSEATQASNTAPADHIPTPQEDDAGPHKWWTAEMFRVVGGCFSDGDSPAKEVKAAQGRAEEPTVNANRDANGYTVSVEVHEGDGYYTYYRRKEDCEAAHPRHLADANQYQ